MGTRKRICRKQFIWPLLVTFGLTGVARADNSCFIVIENHRTIKQQGDADKRHSPCSTFKIAISLMGFDNGFLVDEKTPEIPFKPGYVDWFESRKQPQTPSSWIKNSCVWYSQVITTTLGLDKFRAYVQKFHYGNLDISGDRGKNNGLTNCWLCSSLQISPREQIRFLSLLLTDSLPVSREAQQLTRTLLFVDELEGGWKLYGKTGSGSNVMKDGSRDESKPIGWFVGWVEREGRRIIFAQFIEERGNPEDPIGSKAREIAKNKLLKILAQGNSK